MDEKIERYMEVFIDAGKPIGEYERDMTLPLWRTLTEAQKDGAIRDAQAMLPEWRAREPRYRTCPKKHLEQKPWTRVHKEAADSKEVADQKRMDRVLANYRKDKEIRDARKAQNS